MSTPIFDREFKHPNDGWYHIEPRGEHLNAAAGVVLVIDDEACATIVNRFNADADSGTLSHGNEMLIDHEHFSHDQDKETRAFGWLTRLQNRADGIYGRVRWTATGKEAVDGGDYRFFSTEYDPENVGILNYEAGKQHRKIRPLELAGLTLTNRPNNRGGRPITNRSLEIPAESSKDDKAIAAKLFNRASELKGSAPARSFDDCWQQAQRELLAAARSIHC